MTYKEMQEQIQLRTDSQIADIEKLILEQYATAQEEINKLLAAQYAKLAGSSPDDYYNEVMKYNRLNQLLADVKLQYATAAKEAGKLIRESSQLAMSNAYYEGLYVSSWLEQYPEIKLGELPTALINVTVDSSDSAWAAINQKVRDKITDTFGSISEYYPKSGTLSQLLTENLEKELRLISDAITQGLVSGESYKKMTDRISVIIGEIMKRDGTYTASGAVANALRIVRTESGRTLNAGTHAADSYLESNGVDIEKQWYATRDARTRTSSESMDGQRVPIHKPFSNGMMYPSDYNERCTTLSIIDGENPADIMRGRNPVSGENEILSFESMADWAKRNNLARDKYGKLYIKE